MTVYVSKTRNLHKSLRQAGVSREVDVTTVRGRHSLEQVLTLLEGREKFGPCAVSYYEELEPEKTIEGYSDGWRGASIKLPDRKPVYYGFTEHDRGGWGLEGLGLNSPQRLEILGTEVVSDGYQERIVYDAESSEPHSQYELRLNGRYYTFNTVAEFEEWCAAKPYLHRTATATLRRVTAQPVIEMKYHFPVNRVHWRYTYKPKPVGWVVLTSP